MTVSTDISRSGPYACNGAQVAFDFNFDIELSSDLRVIHTDAAGVETVLSETVDYTVSTGPWPTGGVITTVSTYPAGEFITILRSLDYKQLSDYSTVGTLPPERIESDLDRVTKLIQQIKELTDRCLVLPESTTVSGVTLDPPDPGKLLSWDPTQNKIIGVAIADLNLAASGVLITAFGESLVEAPNAAAALALLTAAGVTLNNTFSGDNTFSGANLFSGVTRFSKTLKTGKGADIAPAAGVLTPGTDGNVFDVTGTAGITSIASVDSNPGSVIFLHFDDALTISYHATDLIMPNSSSFTTKAGDELAFYEYAAGKWRCIVAPRRSRGALVYRSTTQTINSSANTQIQFDVEDYDTDQIHSTVSNTTRLTVPAGVSKIRLSANVDLSIMPDQTSVSVSFYKNGLASAYNGKVIEQRQISSAADNSARVNIVSPVLIVSPGDFFEVNVFHNSGSAETALSANGALWFAMEIIE